MTRLDVKKYEAADMSLIDVRGLVKDMFAGQPIAEIAKVLETAGPAMTIRAPDGTVLACMGVRTFWEGVGEAWAVYSKEAVKYPSIWRKTKQILETSFSNFGFRRVQAIINVADVTAIKMDERMGFAFEGTLRGYARDGADCNMYAIVRVKK